MQAVLHRGLTAKPSVSWSCVRQNPQPRTKKRHASCQACGFTGQPGRGGSCTFRSHGRDASRTSRAPRVSLKARLRGFGFAGVVSYGLLNTVYYVTAFLFFWTHVAKVPRGLGLAETAKRFVGVMSLTWAGSQVTKVARIAAALAMAPVLDGVCLRAQQRLGLASKRTALSLLVVSCIALASLCFGATMLVWA